MSNWKKQKDKTKLQNNKQTQTQPLSPNNYTNGKKVQITGVIVSSLNNMYQIKLRNKQKLLTDIIINNIPKKCIQNIDNLPTSNTNEKYNISPNQNTDEQKETKIIPQMAISSSNHKETQTNIPKLYIIHNNDDYKEATNNISIHGIIIQSFIDKYQIILMDRMQKLTNSNVYIPKELVEISNEHIDQLDIIESEMENENKYEVNESDEHIKSPLYPPKDFTSIRMSYNTNTDYDIKCVRSIDQNNTYLYPFFCSKHRKYSIIQSIFYPHIVYYFSGYEHKNYQYNTITKTWKAICDIPADDEIQSILTSFYFDFKKGLIGILCANECKLRIYNELIDEWTVIEQIEYIKKTKSSEIPKEVRKPFKIDDCMMTLDTKRNVYHFVSRRDHYIYDINAFKLIRIGTTHGFSASFAVMFVYNEYNDSLIGMERMGEFYEYSITNKQWKTHKLSFNNFKIDDKHLSNFGYINLNNLNKIILFGGSWFATSKYNYYLFELDLNRKGWNLLNPKLYQIPNAFDVGSFFIEPFISNDNYYKINIFDKDWESFSDCNHCILYVKPVNNYNDNKYAEFTEICIRPNINENDEKKQQFEINSNSLQMIPISTDYISNGIEIDANCSYEIKSIEISNDISFHNTEDCCIVQSVFYPNILYYFNASYKDYKYNTKTKQWQRIAELDQEYHGSQTQSCV